MLLCVYTANFALKSILGVAKLQTANFVLACLGSDWKYSSGLGFISKLGILLLGNLYLWKAVGIFLIGTPFSHLQKLHYCVTHSVYLHDQIDILIINDQVTRDGDSGRQQRG